MKTIYNSPEIEIIECSIHQVICVSVGENTGYSGGNLIDGGDLTDDGEW